MPALGADVEDAILVEWHVKPGDQVKRGDIVAVVETQKGLIEAEVYETGLVEQILVQAGATVPIGTPLAIIRPVGAGEPAAPDRHDTRSTTGGRVERAAVPPTTGEEVRSERLRVSPLARKLAAELGVDLGSVQGTGPGGAVQKADIERAARVAPSPPSSPATIPGPPPDRPSAPRVSAPEATSTKSAVERQAAMRAAIAAAMARSKREIPHYYLGSEIDLNRALTWLEVENRKRSVSQRLLPAVLFLKAAALALREVPELNGFWRDGTFQPSEAVHLGVAISLRQSGLIAPAIHHADLQSLDALMEALRDLVMRARSGMLRASELTDPTVTVTNLGDHGVPTVFGVIYPPQVALIGFGTIVQRPWVVGGLLGIRPIISATLSADHRASDGHRGARYLTILDRLLQEPEKL
jgi:pyruvate dehydrogenase E2 component (dihydrolipoamide acetyltransferase)